jgi:hypothetical protein
MTMTKAANGAQATDESVSPPYRPSWVDGFTDLVARLPGPSWLYYPGMGLALFLLQAAILWGEEADSASDLVSIGFITTMAFFFLALIHYLDHKADAVLADLRPVLTTSESEYARLRFQLTTLPAGPTLLSSLAGVAWIVLTNELRTTSSFDELADYMYMVALGIFFPFVYHMVHQLRVINLIYSRYTSINLFRLKPLQAFNGITAIRAVSLPAVCYAWLVLNPDEMNNPLTLGIVLPVNALAFASFVWPVLGAHRLLVERKERMLYETSLRFQAAIVELHQRVDDGKLEGMGDLNMTMSSLQIEQGALEKISTWPWQPETVRLLITALALPLGLWIAQYALQNVLGQ